MVVKIVLIVAMKVVLRMVGMIDLNYFVSGFCKKKIDCRVAIVTENTSKLSFAGHSGKKINLLYYSSLA